MSIPNRTPPWWLNPYLFIGLAALCVPVAEMLLKRGAMATALRPTLLPGVGTSVLGSGWAWLGIVFYVASFICWLHVLRHVPLHLAFSLMGVVHVLVPLGSWWFLGETIGLCRWCGIALLVVGVVVIAGPAMHAEERL